jgi:magnesium transporter
MSSSASSHRGASIAHSGSMDMIKNNGFSWIDLQKPSRQDMEMLGRQYSFHELNLEDCLSKNQLPKVESHGNYIFIILHFPTIEKEKNIPKFSQLSVFAGVNYLMTVHQGDLKPLAEMFQQCKENDKQRQTFMGRSAGYLIHSIIDALVDDLLHLLKKIIGNLDDIEDAVFDEKVTAAKEISLLRREITILRRIVIPLKRIVSEFITKDINRLSEEDLAPYFTDVKGHIDKVLETLDEAKETIEIYKDTDFMLSTEKSNKILAVLTIIFTLSIPATMASSLFGMNVNVPGGIQTGSWNFFGPFSTFMVILMVSAVSAAIMLYYFKSMGWIGAVK